MDFMFVQGATSGSEANVVGLGKDLVALSKVEKYSCETCSCIRRQPTRRALRSEQQRFEVGSKYNSPDSDLVIQIFPFSRQTLNFLHLRKA